MVQLSYPYMTTVKTTALTIQTFVSKVTPQLFNMLSILVIAYLSCLQSPSAMILEPTKIKSVTVSTVSPSICHEVQWLTLFFGAPKSLQMVIAAMKLKDAYSLEGKL